MDVFIHEEYVNKRREQRQQQQQRRRWQMKTQQIETEKRKPQAQQSAATGYGFGSPREQPAGAWSRSSPAGSPTAEAASFRDHLFGHF